MGQAEDPKACLAGKFTQAAGYKGEVEEEPRKLETGQMYEVVANFVAVRKLPSLEAPFVRRLKKGAKVEMFEWDKTRRWRRVCIEAPVDAETKPRAPTMTEAQRRWATGEPVWDSARGKWVDAAPKIEVLDSDSDAEDAVVRRDAWIMVHHPEMGLLLQAVQPGDLPEAQLSDPAANEPKPVKRQQDQHLPGQAAVPATAAFAVEKARFDFYWGNTPNAAPPPLQSQPVVQGHGPQILPAARHDADFAPEVPAEPALISAVRSGDEESVRVLLQTGHDPNIVDALGETPLFEAASAANLRIVAALLLHGADSLHRSEHGAVAADVAEDPATRALLRRWDGQDSVPKSDLVQMLGKLTEADAKSVASRLKLEVSMEESQPETPAQIDPASPGVRYRVVYKK
ncbi:Bard1, partial [Symbiodinium sp. CCMP2592]